MDGRPSAISTSKRGFSALFEEDEALLTVQDQVTIGQADEQRKAKLQRQSYVLHVGPKFRKGHNTPFRATNVQVIRAEEAATSVGQDAAPTHSLFDFVVDDVRAGTVRAYTGLDIVLDAMIHPESPKLIKMTLQQLDLNETLDEAMYGVQVPLYLNLTKANFQDVLWQLGLPKRDKDVALVRMNIQGSAEYKIDPSEQFINQLIGRMGRHRTNVQSTWDRDEAYFQHINFKIRIGPQKRNRIEAISNISRGTGKQPDAPQFFQDTQKDQFDDYQAEVVSDDDDEDKEFRRSKIDMKRKQEQELEEFLNTPPVEDGTTHAGVLEHVMRMTTHRVMSPRLRAALASVSALIRHPIETKSDLEKLLKLDNGAGRSHMMALVEADMQEGESMLRSYRDPRADDALRNARVFAAGRLIKALARESGL